MIYLSGPISNTPDYKERFQIVEDRLTPKYGHKILNPVKATRLKWERPELVKWQTLMLYCLECLSYCDKIYMMKGWENSAGCKMELLWAEKMGIEVEYEC